MAEQPSSPLSVDARELPADATTLDALARLALDLGRRGRQLRLCDPSPELLALIEFAGLSETLVGEPQAGGRGGSPNSGNSRSVSRKKVSSPMPADDSSNT
jgi:anti-anti-sigma regulatory factor